MVQIDIRYEGQLRCHAVHGPSGTELTSDAPVDNRGRGASFSPTDLLATALGTCMLTIMGIRSQERGYAIEGTHVTVHKHMSQSGPRRVIKLDVHVRVAGAGRLSEDDRRVLVDAALTCPVRLSIHEGIEVPVGFEWSA